MTIDLLDAEDRGISDLCVLLGCGAPTLWPPEFHGPDTRRWMRRLLDEAEDSTFTGYSIVAELRPVGTCGFKGPPDAEGRVDIGYSIVAPERKKAYAKAAVRQLLTIAFADPRVTPVVAETIPSRVASERTAESCGFVLTSRRPEEDLGEILTYSCLRPTLTPRPEAPGP
jgi:RimJ/RimL family protein N-acetyltransferase